MSRRRAVAPRRAGRLICWFCLGAFLMVWMAVVLITLDHHSRQLGVAHTGRVVKQYIVREEEAIVRGHRLIAGKVQGALGLKRDDDDDDGAPREMPEEHAVDDFDDDDDDDAGEDDAARKDDDDAAAARKAARDDDDDGAARPADRAARPPRAPKRPGGAASDRPPSFEEFLEQEGVDRDVPPNRAVPLVERPEPNREPPASKIPAGVVEPNREPPAGVVDHGILFYDDAAFRSESVAAMLAPYARTRGGGSCDADFGNRLIDRWRDKRKTYCAPRSDGSDPSRPPSRIDCFLLMQTGHAGHGDNLCEATNVRLNFADFADGETATRQFDRYVAARHAEWEAHVSYRKGALAADCDPDPELWRTEHFPGWNAHWAGAFARVDDLKCDVWEDAPTLVVERDTFANLFHDSEDFVNAFIALAVLRWSTADLQILLTDIYPEGPFWDMWSKVFRGTRPPLTAWQIGQKYGDKNVCFKKVAIGILGAAAPTTLHTTNTRCQASSVVRAYSDFVIRGLGLQGAARYAAPDGDPRDVVVTFLARRSSSEWPEKRFCDSETSFFDCAKLQHLGVRGLGRTIKNDAEVVRALKSLETRSFANGARVRFRDVDYNLLSFEDQVKVDLDTDVMVGPHGAGLLHNIFMPDRGHLVELGIDGSSNLRHFHNLATWQGRAYTGGPMANPVPVDRLLDVVAAAVAGLDLSKPY